MASVADDYLDEDIRHQIDLIWFQNSVVAKLLLLLDMADRDMKMRMFDFFESGRTDADTFLAAEHAYSERAMDAIRLELETATRDLVREESNSEILVLLALLGIGDANVLRGTPGPVVPMGNDLSTWFRGLARHRERIVNSGLRMALSEGRSFSHLSQNLFGGSGLLRRARKGVEMVARTTLTAAIQSVREAIARANPWLIKALRYTAVLDSRTTARCRSLDGNIYPVDVGPRPPQHPNCRSWMIFVFNHYSKMGLKNPPQSIKDRFTGEPPARLTYTDWLRGRSKSVQREVLGVKRSKMFRNDPKMTMKTFVNRQGRQLTLAELTARR